MPLLWTRLELSQIGRCTSCSRGQRIVASCWLGTPAVISSEQGNPFRLLQTRAGLETLYQPEHAAEDEQLKAVVDCVSSAPSQNFDLLNSQGKIREIPTEEQRIEALVDDYLTRPIERREHSNYGDHP